MASGSGQYKELNRQRSLSSGPTRAQGRRGKQTFRDSDGDRIPF